jgi:hypothetical protein
MIGEAFGLGDRIRDDLLQFRIALLIGKDR